MGEAENKTHLSRLARARGAIGYIGFFVALTQTLVRRTGSSRSLPIYCDLFLIVLYRQGAPGGVFTGPYVNRFRKSCSAKSLIYAFC